jgi:iron(III) transport system substrate-binding protein
MRRRIAMVVSAAVVSMLLISPLRAQERSLIEAAKKEGTVVWYTALALDVSERFAEIFQKAYGIHVELTRTGTGRIVTRVLQEAQAGLQAVDVIEVSDAGDFALLKQKGVLTPYNPRGYERFHPAFRLDREGYYYAWRATLGLPVYNPKIVPPAEVPKTWRELADPKWKGKLAKVHSGSGAGNNIMAAMTRLYGWDFYRKIKQDDPLIVLAASEGVSKIAAGERAILVEGNHYNAARLKARGNPVDFVFPAEGVVLILSPVGIAKRAPHPNAARLFEEFMFNTEMEQQLVNLTSLYVPNPSVRYPPEMPPLEKLKLLTVSVDELANREPEINRMFTEIFGS